MLECTQRRTHNLLFGFLFGFLLLQGLFFYVSSAQGQAASVVGPDITRTDKSATAAPTAQSTTPTTKATDSSTGILGCLSSPVKCLVIPLIDALRDGMAWIASGAAALFVWVVHPDNISGPNGMLNKGAIYDLWRFIRDFFNIFFILILLVSAFATIFQLESFSIRKIFLNILIAALIINFSFPITRFLIDLTNVPMYYFLNQILPGTNGGEAFTRQFLGATGMSGIALNSSATFTQAFTGLVFMFLFTISLVVLGVLMLVRLIALTLLLVFSPFGFAATLLPGLQKYGSDWWNSFWKYALFGPSAALMLLVAIRFQNQIGRDSTFKSVYDETTRMSAGGAEASAIALITFYAIPLILIWTAIGMANKSSIAGAGMVTGLGYGAAKKVGKWTGGKLGGNAFVSWKKQREAAREDAKGRSYNARFGKWVAGKQDKLAAKYGVTKGARNDAARRIDQERVEKVKKSTEGLNLSQMEPSQLKQLMNSRPQDKYLAAAVAQELAKKGQLDVNAEDPAGRENRQIIDQVKNTFGETSTVFRQLNNEIKKFDPVTAFANMTKNIDGTDIDRNKLEETQWKYMKEYINGTEFDAKKLGPNSLKNNRFMQMAIEDEAISAKEIDDLRGKSSAHKKAVVKSLDAIVLNANDATKDAHKRIQEIHFAQTGGIITSEDQNGQKTETINPLLKQNADWQKHIYSRMNKDNSKRLSNVLATDRDVVNDMMQHMSSGRVKDIILNIENTQTQANFAQAIREGITAGPNQANAERVQEMVQNHRDLKNV